MKYAKFGTFFCDCGAKDDGSGEALVRRLASVPEADEGASSHRTPVEASLAAAFRRPPFSPSALLVQLVSEALGVMNLIK